MILLYPVTKQEMSETRSLAQKNILLVLQSNHSVNCDQVDCRFSNSFTNIDCVLSRYRPKKGGVKNVNN
jgi:hypothetical protein